MSRGLHLLDDIRFEKCLDKDARKTDRQRLCVVARKRRLIERNERKLNRVKS